MEFERYLFSRVVKEVEGVYSIKYLEKNHPINITVSYVLLRDKEGNEHVRCHGLIS